ncbi:MAG: hypothetical protein A2857_01060 [Candidatus Levybacteria bacterium RIFCSPHIGHO2_01_FULL_36_15]|nr:MAG: hypothetical protein A2857_01060 [Candidatus Levybacteria bacterium RIFCSPHIGHO2_01_FULL_36_15]OGH38624.1 MAG: hypothetical protein A2905_04410 [Candidatus Levybacteria bacterium RIFCSPLOWO2_01_FULL_36_10]
MINFITDVLFSKKCVNCKKLGSYICPECFSTISFSPNSICPVCNKNSIDSSTHSFCKSASHLDGLTCGVIYKGVVRRLIHEFKYKPYIADLKKIIAKLLYEALVQDEIFSKILELNPIVVPVPLYKIKERTRGYNHAALIAKIIAEKFSLQFLDDALIRVKDTKPQFDLNKDQRRKNIKDAFVVNRNLALKITQKPILLIDDVITTCSTLNECARMLKKQGANLVWGVTFAREL